MLGKMLNKITKKAALENLIKIILWTVFFLIAGAGLYFLIKFLTNW